MYRVQTGGTDNYPNSQINPAASLQRNEETNNRSEVRNFPGKFQLFLRITENPYISTVASLDGDDHRAWAAHTFAYGYYVKSTEERLHMFYHRTSALGSL